MFLSVGVVLWKDSIAGQKLDSIKTESQIKVNHFLNLFLRRVYS